MGRDRREAYGILSRQLPLQPPGNLRHANGLHRRKRWIELFGQQRLDLLNRAVLEHGSEASCDTAAQYFTLGYEDDPLDLPVGKQGRLLATLEFGQLFSGGALDREGANDALGIGHADARGRLRVFCRQHCHAPRLVQFFDLFLDPECNRRGNSGDICESLCQRIEVKACSTDENHLAPRVDRGENFADGIQPLPGGKAMSGRHSAVKTVLGKGFLLDARPGRYDAQRVVDLHGVGVDDQSLPRLGARQGEGRLAAGSGTRYQDGTPLNAHQFLPKAPVLMPVLSLIANPADPELDAALAAAVVQQTGGELNWLNHGVACDISEPTAPQALQIARDVIGTKSVDANLVPTEGRRKLILVADMDSTMIEQECIDELAAALGLKDQVAEITDRAMRGELDFGAALDTRVALLKGLERSVIEEVRREAITLAPGGRALVQTMKAYGAYTSLVSGGFTFFADYFGKRIGFDEAIANVLEFDGDVLTGTVAKPIVDKNTKRERLLALAAERGVDPSLTIAVGDGANDLDMIRVAGFGVALHAKPTVAAEAGIRIDHGDLTALLYLQGFYDDDFVR